MNASELFDLSGKVAVITGGAGSIGTAYGRALGEAGASVVLADVAESAATKAADALKADGLAAVGVAVDVSDLASAQAMARTAVDTFGGIDILVNNAAIMRDLPQYGLSNMPVDEWDRVMNVNLRGPLLCSQAVLPRCSSGAGGGSSTALEQRRSNVPTRSSGGPAFLPGIVASSAVRIGDSLGRLRAALGGDEPGGDRVDVDALGSELRCEVGREAVQRVLGDAVDASRAERPRRGR